MTTGTERRSTIVFIIVAAILATGAVVFGRWISLGGPSRTVAKPGQIVFISDRTGSPDLWIMDEDGGNAHRLMPIPGEERETVFAPDGEWVYFTSEFGGADLLLGKVRPNGRSAGRVLSSSAGSQSSLSVSKGGQEIGYISSSRGFVCDADGRNPHYMLPSHADEKMQVGPSPIAEAAPPERRYSFVALSNKAGWAAAISQGYDNQRGYLTQGDDRITTSLLNDKKQALLAETIGMAWSPDGSRLAVATAGPPGGSYLAIYEPSDGLGANGTVDYLMPVATLARSEPATYGLSAPAWSPDGETIAFAKQTYTKDGGRKADGIWAVSASGGTPRCLVKGDAANPQYSPGGRYLLYESGPDLWRLDVQSGATKNLTGGKGINRYASWSPILRKSK